jgi:uncharacterized membrane protein
VSTASDPPARGAVPTRFFRRGYLYLLTVLASIYLGVTLLAPTPWLELPLGLVTLFFTPGYAIGCVTFGARSRWPRSLEFALVVGWSVAWNVALGVVLLVLGFGLPAYALALLAWGLVFAVSLGWTVRPPDVPQGASPSPVAQVLGMSGYSRRQRAGAYVLLAGIVSVFLVILYLASVFPVNTGPALTLSIGGANGSTGTLPTGGPTNTTLEIWVSVQNNATVQEFTLAVQTATVGSSPTSYRSVAWSTPLRLANATQSEQTLNLTSSQATTVPVSFEYPIAGHYALAFLLYDSHGALVRSASWTVLIS